jgi:hypothetical protein
MVSVQRVQVKGQAPLIVSTYLGSKRACPRYYQRRIVVVIVQSTRTVPVVLHHPCVRTRRVQRECVGVGHVTKSPLIQRQFTGVHERGARDHVQRGDRLASVEGGWCVSVNRGVHGT